MENNVAKTPNGVPRRWLLLGCALALLAAGLYWAWPLPPVPCSHLQHWNAADSAGRCVIDTSLRLDSYDPWAKDLRQLPDRLTVRGNLIIYGTRIESLPASLVVEGNLVLHKTHIGRLPADLVVNVDLDVYMGFGSPELRCADIPASVVIKGQRLCHN